MKEHPIIFSTDMVKAILEGRKTMTRRVIKLDNPDEWVEAITTGEPVAMLKDGTGGCMFLNCPYGQIGDRLWVRETWAAQFQYDLFKPSEIPMTSDIWFFDDKLTLGIGKSRPSIFMPRWASRLTLEITALRVERLQEITEGNAYGEGCPSVIATIATVPMVNWYKQLWDSLNKKRGYGWDKNPWVWVISFRKLEAVKK